MDLIDVESVRVARDRADLALGMRPLGGGTWLYSEPQPGTSSLLDLTGFGWNVIDRSTESLTVGATTTIETLRALPEPIFQQCADSLLASWKIQRIATVGGNIALALPAGPMTSLAVALDASLLLWAADSDRVVPAASFVTGVLATILEPGEVIRSMSIPVSSLHRTAFRRIALSPLGRTGTLVIGRRDATGETVLTVTGGTTRPHQLRFDAPPTPAAVTAAVDAIDDWYDDAHGSPDWRHAMSRRFALEILEELA